MQGRSGRLNEIPSMVGVWTFSGTTHYHLLQIRSLLKAENPQITQIFTNPYMYSMFSRHLEQATEGSCENKGRSLVG